MITYRVLEYAIREKKRQSKNFSSDAKLCGLLIVLLIPDLLYFDHRIAQDPQTPAYPPGWEKYLQNGIEHFDLQRIYTFYILY